MNDASLAMSHQAANGSGDIKPGCCEIFVTLPSTECYFIFMGCLLWNPLFNIFSLEIYKVEYGKIITWRGALLR